MIARPYPYEHIVTGEVKNSVTGVALPSVPVGMVNIKALSTNAATVHLGKASVVTRTDGTTNTTAGLPLAAGQETGWFSIDNLNKLGIIGANANDSIVYMVLN